MEVVPDEHVVLGAVVGNRHHVLCRRQPPNKSKEKKEKKRKEKKSSHEGPTHSGRLRKNLLGRASPVNIKAGAKVERGCKLFDTPEVKLTRAHVFRQVIAVPPRPRRPPPAGRAGLVGLGPPRHRVGRVDRVGCGCCACGCLVRVAPLVALARCGGRSHQQREHDKPLHPHAR